MDKTINLNISKKPKVLIIAAAALIIIALAVAGYFCWNWLLKTKALKGLEKASGAAEKILDDVTKGVLPSLETNPLENKPDVNPAAAGNPIKNIKTNPFK